MKEVSWLSCSLTRLAPAPKRAAVDPDPQVALDRVNSMHFLSEPLQYRRVSISFMHSACREKPHNCFSLLLKTIRPIEKRPFSNKTQKVQKSRKNFVTQITGLNEQWFCLVINLGLRMPNAIFYLDFLQSTLQDCVHPECTFIMKGIIGLLIRFIRLATLANLMQIWFFALLHFCTFFSHLGW